VVAHLLDLAQQVAGHEHGPALVAQATQEAPDIPDPRRIQAVGRLVEHQQLRILQQRRCQPQALLHPQRVRRQAIVGPIGKAHTLQRLVNRRFRDSFGTRQQAEVPPPRETEKQGLGLDHRPHPALHPIELALGVHTENPAAAGGRTGQPQEVANRGRLARAVGTEEAEHSSRRHTQVQPVDRHRRRSPPAAVLLAETLDRDHRRRRHGLDSTTLLHASRRSGDVRRPRRSASIDPGGRSAALG
jgi:hypothetical protein